MELTVSSRLLDTYFFIVGRREGASVGTVEFFWSVAWLMTSALILTYVSYLYFGRISVFAESPVQQVTIMDVISKQGEHHLSGTVRVPSPCHGLSVKTIALSDTAYQLAFTTWQEPSRTCEPHEQVRAFQTVVFAPSTGVSFVATLDGAALPVTVFPRH